MVYAYCIYKSFAECEIFQWLRLYTVAIYSRRERRAHTSDIALRVLSSRIEKKILAESATAKASCPVCFTSWILVVFSTDQPIVLDAGSARGPISLAGMADRRSGERRSSGERRRSDDGERGSRESRRRSSGREEEPGRV